MKKNKLKILYICLILIFFTPIINTSPISDNGENIISNIIKIPRNQTHELSFIRNIGEIFIEDPSVVDVQVLRANKIRLFTLAVGMTRVVINDRLGNRLIEFTVEIIPNLEELNDILREVFPHLRIHLKSIKHIVFVSGSVPNPKIASEVMKVIKAYINKDDQVINNLEISMPTQVMIRVKIAEVRRTVSKSLGIDWAMFSHNKPMVGGKIQEGFNKGIETAVLGANKNLNLDTIGIPTTEAFPIRKLMSSGDSAKKTGSIFNYVKLKDGFSYNISAFIDAMASESLATILAEPTLVTLSGQTASFTVGGEKPYQTSSSNGTNVEFKTYGVSLNVTPTIVSENLINIKVEPDISEPQSSDKEIGPSMETRKVSTTVELADGQSIVIAGLLKKSSGMETGSSSPLASIPFIGALFKNAGSNKEETELIVVVTAYIVKPIKEDIALPTDSLELTNPNTQVFLGRMNKTRSLSETKKDSIYERNRMPVTKDSDNNIITSKNVI